MKKPPDLLTEWTELRHEVAIRVVEPVLGGKMIKYGWPEIKKESQCIVTPFCLFK